MLLHLPFPLPNNFLLTKRVSFRRPEITEGSANWVRRAALVTVSVSVEKKPSCSSSATMSRAIEGLAASPECIMKRDISDEDAEYKFGGLINQFWNAGR